MTHLVFSVLQQRCSTTECMAFPFLGLTFLGVGGSNDLRTRLEGVNLKNYFLQHLIMFVLQYWEQLTTASRQEEAELIQ